jgi:hypothetical protein
MTRVRFLAALLKELGKNAHLLRPPANVATALDIVTPSEFSLS